MAPPLRFPVGLLCRFSVDNMASHFFGFFLSAQVWSHSKLMSSLQRLPIIVIVVTSSGSLVAHRFTVKAHATCQCISTVSSGVTLDRVQPDFNLTKARLVTKKLELKAPGGRPTW